ncbi:MAG: hypothetical protein ACR2N4_06930 [Jatrophihabitans sp.]
MSEPEQVPRRPNWRHSRRASTGPLGGPLFGRLGERLVALSPFVAIVLFFTVARVWWIFLIVPAAGALVYGNIGRWRSADRK